MPDWFDPQHIVEIGGLTLLLLVLFAESGLLFGIFLPGESLLIAAGILSNSKYFGVDILTMLALINVASIGGYTTGYFIGKYSVGIMENINKYQFVSHYLSKALIIYEKHESKALVLWRYFPFIRTFLPVAAGLSGMAFGRFMIFNVAGSILWSCSFVVPAYIFGHEYEKIANSIIAIVVLLLLVLIMPFVKVYIYKNIKPVLKKDYETILKFLRRRS